MIRLDQNKVGLTLGVFAAVCHLVWIIAVLAGIQKLVDWVFLLHSIKLDLVLTSVVPLNVVYLVILGFIGGYIFGWVFAGIWNLFNKR